jgi:dephospho-CoA kinase
MSEEEARRRMAAQSGEEERRARADYVISNDGTLAQLEERVEAFLRELGRDEGPRSE